LPRIKNENKESQKKIREIPENAWLILLRQEIYQGDVALV